MLSHAFARAVSRELIRDSRRSRRIAHKVPRNRSTIGNWVWKPGDLFCVPVATLFTLPAPCMFTRDED